MKILFLDGYFLPERTAFTHLEDDLIKGLVDRGYEIVIVTPTPSRGLTKEKIKEYKNKTQEFLFDGKVEIKRVKVPKEPKSKILRTFRFLLYNINEYIVASKLKDIDLILTYTAPPTQGLIARKLKKKYSKVQKKNIPFVFNVQDMFPESLLTINMAKKDGFLFKIGEKIQNKILHTADKIITIGLRLKKRIQSYGIDENKVLVIENWINPNELKPIKKQDNPLFDDLGIDRKDKIVLYAGNVGPSRPIDFIFELADKFVCKDDIKFVIIGGGVGFKEIQTKAQSHSNVIVHPYYNFDKVAYVYNLGDINLCVGSKYDGIVGFPSKTYNILACNKPIVALYSKESDFADLLLKLDAGVIIENKDIDLFADVILEILNNKEKYSNEKGRQYVLENASTDICVKRYIDCFEQLLKE